MNTQRMKKAAKNLDMLVKVAGGIFGGCAWALVIIGVLVLILGEQMYEMGSLTLELDYVTLYLAQDAQAEFSKIKIGVAAGLIVAGMVLFLASRGAKLLRGILVSMKEGRPFEADAAANLRKIAWMWLIGGGVFQVWKVLDRVLMTMALPMERIFASEAITKVVYTFAVDFSFVWVAVVILFLSYVFEYGRALQVESDETL